MTSATVILRPFSIIICFSFFLNHAGSRFLKHEESANILSRPGDEAVGDDNDEDLENVVMDYYDDLWQYLDTVSNKIAAEEAEKNKKKKKEEETKVNFADYDYMSDMAVAETAAHESKFKLAVTDSTREENSTPSSQGSQGNFQISDSVRASRESNLEEEPALRSKEMRLKSIINQVLSFRGGSSKSNETVPDIRHSNALREIIYDRNRKKIKSGEWASSYTEKVQSFYPSCEIPRNTDEDVWYDPYSMNLFFDLDYPNPPEDSKIVIVSAKLRLYKLPQDNLLTQNVEMTSQKSKTNGLWILPNEYDDRQIRVSVYWYTKSLRRNRIKKKLLDSQMLFASAPKWTEFNIQAAVRTWKDSGKNFGLVVTVEDEDRTLLPADQYIQSMNCSKWTATVRPIPSVILDKAHQYYIENEFDNKQDSSDEIKPKENKIYAYESLLYPIVDLRTMEVPVSDVKNVALINSAKIALESKFVNLTRHGLNLGNNSITIVLKNYNLDFVKGVSSLGKLDRSIIKKADEKVGEPRVKYFQNVPIGSPSMNQHKHLIVSNGKKNYGGAEESDAEKIDPEFSDRYSESDRESEREIPRIRHNRRQWEAFQKPSNSRQQNDFNATDHH